MRASEWEALDRESWRRAFAEAELPVLRDLREVGLELGSIEDLQHLKLPSDESVEVLTRWLPRVEHPGVKEAMARGLAERRARTFAAPVLFAEYRHPENDSNGIREALGVALGQAVGDEHFDELGDLIRDLEVGTPGRSFLVEALGRMKDPRAFDLAVELLDDEDVDWAAVRVLGDLKDDRARRHLERFVEHPDRDMRKYAETALRKLDRSAKGQREADPN